LGPMIDSTPASRRRGSFSLAEYPGDMVRLVCTRCGRHGQYRKTTLLERYGPDIPLPDLRHEIAQCEPLDRLTGGCGVYYEDLRPGFAPCAPLPVHRRS
jgi:hypothetical protein